MSNLNLSFCTKIYSRWIRDLIVRLESDSVREKQGETIPSVGVGSEKMQKAQETDSGTGAKTGGERQGGRQLTEQGRPLPVHS